MLFAVLHGLELLLSELNFHLIARHFRIRNGGKEKEKKRGSSIQQRGLLLSFRGDTTDAEKNSFVRNKKKKDKTPLLCLVYAFGLRLERLESAAANKGRLGWAEN